METKPKTGKKRFFNFTEEEKFFLLFHVQRNKEVIDSKDTGAASLQRKKTAWSSITELFNQEPGHTKRTTQQLQKLFFNLKNKRKKELAKAEVKKIRLMPGFENYCNKSMSETEEYSDKDEFDDKDALTNDKDDSNDEFTDENNDDDPIDDLVNSTLPRAVYEPIIKLEPVKKKLTESVDSDKTLNELRMKEAEVRIMIANEQLEEARIKKETASIIQRYEIKYYEEKIKALNNIQSGSQLQ